ncbi:MAG: acyl carrier protein [Clostridia bacterium]|nr:acyl carrier protein [Clostridia bacterium]
MFNSIKQIIEEQLGITDSERITLDTNLEEDLGADSLDAVEIIMAIEDEFDVEIPEHIAEELKTVSEIIAYLESAK